MEANDSQLQLASVIGDWGRHEAIPDDAVRRAMRVAVEAFDAGGSPVDACDAASGFLRGFFAHPANRNRHLSASARRALAEPTERAARARRADRARRLSVVAGVGLERGDRATRPHPSTGLRIGLVAPPWLPVPPTVYGGTELVVDQLARGLDADGCQVVLFTTGDATCPVASRWVYPRARGQIGNTLVELHHVQRAYEALTDVDLVHDHTVLGPLWATMHRPGLPVVTTAHGEFTPELIDLYCAIADRVGVIAISHAQRRSAPSVRVARVIHHGIDVAGFPLGRGDGGYVLFLGRMSPDKGVHRAVAVARAARKRLLIAAKMTSPAERAYYEQEVAPMLGHDAVYVGEVGGRRKLALLAGAEALVNPIRWPEPFGLVMIEALACGTPVLTFAEGAAPEIVEHGRTGFLCATAHEMVARVRDVADLNRADCRASVATRFSATRMVREHIDLYRDVLADRLGRADRATMDTTHPLTIASSGSSRD